MLLSGGCDLDALLDVEPESELKKVSEKFRLIFGSLLYDIWVIM